MRRVAGQNDPGLWVNPDVAPDALQDAAHQRGLHRRRRQGDLVEEQPDAALARLSYDAERVPDDALALAVERWQPAQIGGIALRGDENPNRKAATLQFLGDDGGLADARRAQDEDRGVAGNGAADDGAQFLDADLGWAWQGRGFGGSDSGAGHQGSWPAGAGSGMGEAVQLPCASDIVPPANGVTKSGSESR